VKSNICTTNKCITRQYCTFKFAVRKLPTSLSGDRGTPPPPPMALSYRKLVVKRYPRLQERESAEARYWRGLADPSVQAHPSHVTHLHFCPSAPHHLLVTCGSSVALHSSATGKKVRAYSRFEGGGAYSGVFRDDGRLVAGGDEKGRVVVLETETKSLLRVMGDGAPARAVRWEAGKGTALASASDDGHVRLWDLATGEETADWGGHGDHARALDRSPCSPGIWASGGYDGAVRLWDARVPGGQLAAPATHGGPVESVLFLPGGSLLVSAGSGGLRVWDVLGGMRQVAAFCNHQKSVTCLALDGGGQRLMSGGLDRHVKIYDLATYKVTHGLKFPAPLLSLAISPDDAVLATGTADSSLTLRRRRRRRSSKEDEDAAADNLRTPRTGTLAYMNRGTGSAAAAAAAEGNVAVSVASGGVPKKVRLKAYDQLLRKFRYREALDQALATRNPAVVVSLLEELENRQGLSIALSGRDEAGLEPILAMLVRHVAHPRYASLLTRVTALLLQLYAGVIGESEAVDELLAKLQRQVQAEIVFQKQLHALAGSIDIVSRQEGAATAASTSTR
jgi:U3 small nucleolar RNA-associated protein 15